MQHNPAKILTDMLDASSRILRLTKGITFADYLENEVIQLAVERLFEMLGEALGRLVKPPRIWLMKLITIVESSILEMFCRMGTI